MKKGLQTLILTLLISTAYAQQPMKKIDSMLVNIDKNTFTTAILYERVTPLARLAIFNDSINIADTNYFEQALNELHNASNTQKFSTVEQFRTQYTPKSNYNTVDIGIINTSFNQINYVENNSVISALKLMNTEFIKEQNTLPEFTTKEVLVISPLKKDLRGNMITYRFDNQFLWQYGNKSISSILANFDTATDYVVYSNGNFTNTNITYATTGNKTLRFTVLFTDGSSKITEATVHVKMQASNYTAPNRWSSTDAPNPTDFAFQGYDETTPKNGEIEYRIWYANNGGEGTDLGIIQKPIIIVDGFDPLDKRKIIDADSNEPANKHISIAELMIYVDNSLNVDEDIIEKLNTDGYDVIIVNQPEYTTASGVTIDGGADYIERNGLTHASFYQEVNRNLTVNGSNEQLVIMGPSMGGLITRYALAFMEKKEYETGLSSWNHNTRLWVSIDSPHLGANIPMGAQSLLYTLKNVAGSQDAADYINNELNSTAAKQLLIEQYKQKYVSVFGTTFPVNDGDLLTNYLDGRTISQGFSVDRGRPEFVTFYNNLFNNGLPNSNGYPQNLNKVAMVNGSLTGSKKYKSGSYNSVFSANGEQTIKIKGFTDGPWPFTSSTIHTTTLENYFMTYYGNSHKISYFKTKKPFGWDTTDAYLSNINTRGIMDNVSGGFFGVNNIVASSITGQYPYGQILGAGPNSGWANWGISVNDWSIYTLKPVSSFISTVSALGFKNPNFEWKDAVGNRNLVCTNEIPFDSYYGEEKNTQHISFSEDSFNWLNGWLDGSNPVPTEYFVDTEVIGDTLICANQIKTYTIDIPTTCIGAVNWTVSSNLQIISSTNNSVTIETINSSVYGDGFIAANLENQVVKNIWVGRPNVTSHAILGGWDNQGVNTTSQLHVNWEDNTTEYYWFFGNVGAYSNCSANNRPKFLTSNGYASTMTSPSRYVTVNWGNCTGDIVVNCMAVNSCGQSGIGYKVVNVYNNANSPCDQDPWSLKTYPNPIKKGSLTVSKIAPSIPCDDINPYDRKTAFVNNVVKIYDFYGVLVYKGNFKSDDFTIEDLNLKAGHYALHVTSSNGETIRKLITVE